MKTMIWLTGVATMASLFCVGANAEVASACGSLEKIAVMCLVAPCPAAVLTEANGDKVEIYPVQGSEAQMHIENMQFGIEEKDECVIGSPAEATGFVGRMTPP